MQPCKISPFSTFRLLSKLQKSKDFIFLRHSRYLMNLIASYGQSDDEDESDPWSSCRVSTKRTISNEGDSDQLRVLKKQATSSKLPPPK